MRSGLRTSTSEAPAPAGLADLLHHRRRHRGAGSQFVILEADYRFALALGVFAIVLWVALTYTIFTAFTVKERKPTLDRGILYVALAAWAAAFIGLLRQLAGRARAAA
jgi:hypothetical protein